MSIPLGSFVSNNLLVDFSWKIESMRGSNERVLIGISIDAISKLFNIKCSFDNNVVRKSNGFSWVLDCKLESE